MTCFFYIPITGLPVIVVSENEGVGEIRRVGGT
jgi:hypothetical protein